MSKIPTEHDYNIFLEDGRGQRVLANMLLEGGFFRLNKTPEEQAVENYLKILLAKTGRYPIEGVSSIDRVSMYVAGFVHRPKQKRAMRFVKNLLRMKIEY